MVDKALFSSNSDNWGTPKELFNKLDQIFDFTIDPCANKDRILKSNMINISLPDNGLDWPLRDQRAFVNPPYSQISKWVEHCYKQSFYAEVIVMLIPARTDTKYFHNYICNNASLWFIKGRLKFFGGKNNNSAPFPSMLVIFKMNYNLNIYCGFDIKETVSE